MNIKKAPGPDGLHGDMITNLSRERKERLLDIISTSWTAGKLLKEWKQATVIPIKKPNKDPKEIKSFRPVALTSIVCKLMERTILRRILFQLNQNNLLNKEQHGFKKFHSTIDQIL